MTKMIVYVSHITNNSIPVLYETENGVEAIEGVQSNEAPTKYAILRLKQMGYDAQIPLDEVLCLVTPEVMEQDTFKDFYKESVENFCMENALTPPKFTIIDTNTSEDTGALLNKVIGHIKDDDEIVLETTGGPRTTAMLLTLLSRFLRLQKTKVLFSTYADLSSRSINEIVDSDDLFELLSAAELFSHSGDPSRFDDCLREERSIDSIDNLLKMMMEFYDCIRLSKTKKLTDAIRNLQSAVSKVKKEEFTNNPKLVIFQKLISNIILDKIIRGKNEDEKTLSIIEWCVENGLIQTGLVFFTSKIPSIFLKTKEENDRECEEKFKSDANKIIGKIKNRKGKLCESEKEKIYCYYRSLKYIRNDISHADESDNVEDKLRQMAERIFKANKIPGSKYSSKEIVEAIKDAVSLIREEIKNSIT
jgi:hypothetical protein